MERLGERSLHAMRRAGRKSGRGLCSQSASLRGRDKGNSYQLFTKDLNSPTCDREKTQLRALLGALSWHAQQVAPHVSAEVSLLLSEVTQSTVSTIVRANQLAYCTKAQKEHQMLIHAFSPNEPLCMFAWVDAGSQNRKDGGSTQGIFVGLGPQSMLQGDLGRVTPAFQQN